MSLFMTLSKLKSMKRLRMLTPLPTPNIRLHLFMGPKYAVIYVHLKIFVKMIRPIVIDNETKSVNLRFIFTSSAKSKERISGKNESFTCNTISKKNILKSKSFCRSKRYISKFHHLELDFLF